MDMRVHQFDADPVLAAKVARLASGRPARVMDLFSGCGGISLGFQRAGFRIDAAVEMDPDAARSHALNFHGVASEGFAAHAAPRDITQIEPDALCAELNLGPAEQAIDVLVGGPPCQAYARIGRAKLSDLARNPQAFKVDPRRDLYLTYLKWVRRLRPLAIFIENVPDILNQDGHNVAAEIVELLDRENFDAKYGLLNSAFHGVPQMRDRAFIIAFRRELSISPSLPAHTRHLELPVGYLSQRKVAMRYVDLLAAGSFMGTQANTELPGPVTVEEAIADLPVISGDAVTRGTRRPSAATLMPYRFVRPHSDYAREMREWPGFEAPEGVADHFIRHLPRDGRVFEAMPEGMQYPGALKIAERLFSAEAAKLRLRKGSAKWRELRKAMVPPYKPATFPNRWWKLVRHEPSRTLMAHLGKDCYSHIHYDGAQRRTISVREAARLQSFPDGFKFAGTMNPMFRQIGNAVPPLMAWEIAKLIRSALDRAVDRVTMPAALGQRVSSIGSR